MSLNCVYYIIARSNVYTSFKQNTKHWVNWINPFNLLWSLSISMIFFEMTGEYCCNYNNDLKLSPIFVNWTVLLMFSLIQFFPAYSVRMKKAHNCITPSLLFGHALNPLIEVGRTTMKPLSLFQFVFFLNESPVCKKKSVESSVKR